MIIIMIILVILNQVSKERVGVEIAKMLNGPIDSSSSTHMSNRAHMSKGVSGGASAIARLVDLNLVNSVFGLVSDKWFAPAHYDHYTNY